MDLRANEARFFLFILFFRACSLQNEVSDPTIFWISEITNSSSYRGKSLRKKIILRTLSHELP